MKKFVTLLSLLFWISLATTAQDSSPNRMPLNNDFLFTDGFYLSAQAFLKNDPEIDWDQLGGDLVFNPQAETAHFRLGGWRDSLQVAPEDLSKIWGFSFEGKPYVRVLEAEREGLMHFALVRVRGKISYFTFEEDRVEDVVIKAYNPLTGRPFREGTVETKKRVRVKKMIDMTTGNTAPLEPTTFRSWIADDARLLRTFDELSEAEKTEKLFKMLLIYNDRNTCFMPASQGMESTLKQ